LSARWQQSLQCRVRQLLTLFECLFEHE
jgi:hypothetical protein